MSQDRTDHNYHHHPEPEIEQTFPRGKIRHSIARHINQRRYSPPEEGTQQQQGYNNLAPAADICDSNARPPSPKIRGKEHPFNDGVRGEGVEIDNNEECISPPTQSISSTNTVPVPAEDKGRRHSKDAKEKNEIKICRCDPPIQKYCLRENVPFCVCASSDEPCCQTDIPKVVTRSDCGGIPLGSKLYTHGERSKNRNRGRPCKKDCKKEPPQQQQQGDTASHRKSRGLFRYQSMEIHKPQQQEPTTPPTPQHVASPDANKTVISDDSKKHDHGKAEQQHVGTNTSLSSNGKTDCCGISCSLLWLLLFLIFIWLLLLTSYIFSPWPIGLFAMIVSKLEHCTSQMYFGVEP